MGHGNTADLRTKIIAHVLEETDDTFLVAVERAFARRSLSRDHGGGLERLDDADIDEVLDTLRPDRRD